MNFIGDFTKSKSTQNSHRLCCRVSEDFLLSVSIALSALGTALMAESEEELESSFSDEGERE